MKEKTIMKSKKNKMKSAISIIMAVLICASAQMVASAASSTESFKKNFVDDKKYTLASGYKQTANQWMTFAVDKGVTLDLWGAYFQNGIVLTETVRVNENQSGIRAYYKTGLHAYGQAHLKARGRQVSKEGTNYAEGRVAFL